MASGKPFKVQAVAQLLGTTVDSVRRSLADAGIEVERQETGPKTRLFSVENIFDIAHWRNAVSKDASPSRQIVATIYAPKGGVGKTTIAANLAVLFQLLGAKTIVFDLDFQSNLTLAYGYDSEVTREEAVAAGLDTETLVERHFGHLFADWPGGRANLSDVLKKPYGENGPHLIPSDLTLDRLDTMLTYDAIEGRNAEWKIATLLAEGRSGRNPNFDLSQYDVILFDAAPAKNRMTRGALLASDYVISPVSMEKFSTKALSYLSTVLSEMRERQERCPELVIVGNFFQQNSLRVGEQMATILSTYKNSFLETKIRRSEEFPKALQTDDNIPLSLKKSGSLAARDLMAVAIALLGRVKLFDEKTIAKLSAKYLPKNKEE